MSVSSRPWSPPLTPLSSERLSKIANALGVSTPSPATPSRIPPPTSSYLVHIVPPLSLPHLNSSLTAPPPPTASGYHSHFRRGTLLPVYATLQLQLAAIAREYALPSIAGLVLYLVQEEEPGPRISEDIWKHLWARVWKAEFAPDAPQKLPALTLNTPTAGQNPTSRASSAERSLVPIVAKVEFDIDTRTATWLNPWITSRNLNYSKRMDGNGTPIMLNLPRTPVSEHTSMLDEDDFVLRQPTINRKNIPPRLILDTSGGIPTDVTSLAYLQQPESSDDETEIEDETGAASGKRGGGVFEDLELDFDESFVETEESQYLLTAQLDQIEKNMAQFSPRVLSVDLQQEQDRHIPLRTDLHPEPITPNPTASWPAVPFNSLNSPHPSLNGPPTPQLAVNGVTTSAPKSFNPTTDGNPSAESARRKQLEEDEWGTSRAQYPRLTPKVLGSENVIPLSPDPFGRFSSSPPPESRGSTYWETESTAVDETRTTSSRFSADSIKSEAAPNPNRATMMSVKSIKRLWRRSSKQSMPQISMPPPPPPQTGRLSPNGEPVLQHRSSESISSMLESGAPSPTMSNGQGLSRPSRPSTRPPSLHNFDIPEVNDLVPPALYSSKSAPANTISLDRLRFDQESPYPNPTMRARAPPLTYSASEGTPSGKVSPTPTAPVTNSGKTSPSIENPRNSVRKSILKWKISSSGGRSRTSSMLSVNNPERPSLDKMPPSPRIPDQFLQQQQAAAHAQALLSQQAMHAMHTHGKSVSSTKAPSVISMSKSVSSNGTRYSEDEGRGPSIDESQFEMVSPKQATHALTYPYTTVDRQESM